MSKKDYELIANQISRRIGYWRPLIDTPEGNAAVAVLKELARGLAADLSEGNRRFDIDKFLTACGVVHAKV